MMNLSLQLEVEEKIHEKISASQKLDIMMYLYLMHFRSSLYIQIQNLTLLQISSKVIINNLMYLVQLNCFQSIELHIQ